MVFSLNIAAEVYLSQAAAWPWSKEPATDEASASKGEFSPTKQGQMIQDNLQTWAQEFQKKVNEVNPKGFGHQYLHSITIERKKRAAIEPAARGHKQADSEIQFFIFYYYSGTKHRIGSFVVQDSSSDHKYRKSSLRLIAVFWDKEKSGEQMGKIVETFSKKAFWQILHKRFVYDFGLKDMPAFEKIINKK